MVQAVERAKQVTMAELNAIIGVRGLSILALLVFVIIFSFFLSIFKFSFISWAKLWIAMKPSYLT